jgi:ring-1,2-phenylacetyl-CoA epoxidase subunit PaaC
MTLALADLWPYIDELFVDEPLVDRLEGVAVRPSTIRPAFDAVIDTVLAEAELVRPAGFIAAGGGRVGRHFSTLGYILAEMQVLARQHPGASW